MSGKLTLGKYTRSDDLGGWVGDENYFVEFKADGIVQVEHDSVVVEEDPCYQGQVRDRHNVTGASGHWALSDGAVWITNIVSKDKKKLDSHPFVKLVEKGDALNVDPSGKITALIADGFSFSPK